MPSVTIKFYEGFTKQPNSTERPTSANNARTFTCTWFDGVSVMAPAISLRLSSGSGESETFDNPCRFTYCWISDFERYYWVMDWRFQNGLWIAALEVDVLATYHEAIGNATVFADRCADRKSELYGSTETIDTGLIDNMLPTRADPLIYKETVSLTHIHGGGFTFGTYVLGIINYDENAVGAVAYYAMTNRMFRHFMRAMLSATYLPSTMNINVETAKAILNPFQYVASCNWFPFNIAQVTGQENPTPRTGLKLGWWGWEDDTGPEFYDINGFGQVMAIHEFTLHDHPHAAPLKMKMLNYEPYTEYSFTCPFFGTFTLNRADAPDGLCSLLFNYDLVSGLCQLRIYDGQIEQTGDTYRDMAQLVGRKKLIRTLSGQCACPIQIAQTTSDYGAARVTQMTGSAQAIGNSAALNRASATYMSNALISGIINGGMAIGQMIGGDAEGAINSLVRGLETAGTNYMNYTLNEKYMRPAVGAQNAAIRASASYTSACQRAPRVETTGNNGSILESWFPFEQRASHLIFTTVNQEAEDAGIIEDALEATRTYFSNWVGYAFGRSITIRNHWGFIQGHDPRIFVPNALESEVEAIKEHINNGFFYLG